MADEKALQFLRECLKSYGGAAAWNDFRARAGAADLAQADLKNADLKDYNFSRCNLAAIQLFNADLAGADFTEANLSYADLRRANLANAYLSRANLQVARLEGANLVDTSAEGADMQSAKCGGAYFIGANLAGANLANADFRGATFKYVQFGGAKVEGAKVEDANFTGVKLTPEQTQSLHGWAQAIVDGKTVAQTAEEKRRASRIAPEESHDDLFHEEDCYKILGIASDAGIEDIQRAYRKRAMEYHPDRVDALGEKLRVVAQREFQRVQHAYKSLTRHRARPAAHLSPPKGAPGASAAPRKQISEYTIEDYKQLIEANPTNDRLYYNLGIKYFEKGMYDLAIQSYQKALALNPDNADARHNMKLAELARNLK